MKRNIFLIILLATALPGFSQQEDMLDEALDEFLFGKEYQDSLVESMILNDMDITDIISALYDTRYIYVRSDFENRTFFSGQDLGIDQFNISGQVFYQGAKGLSVGIAGIMYSQFQPKYNTTIVTAGYNNRIKGVKGLNIRASYSRYFFAKIDSVEGNAFNSSANLGFAWQWKIIGSSADFSMLLGNEISGQANWDIFFEIPVIRFGLFNKISFEPEVSFLLGNETVVVGQYVTLPRFSGEIYAERNTFGLMNTTLRIPLSASIGNFDLTAGYNFNFPRSPGTDDTPERTSFFNLSLGYIFDL